MRGREPNAYLPIQLQSKLKLPRIISRRCLACIREQWTNSRHVVHVCEVEHVSDQIHVEPFAKVDAFRDAHIIKYRPGCDPGIAAQVAVELLERRRYPGNKIRCNAGFLQNSCLRVFRVYNRAASRRGKRVGASGEAGQLEVVAIGGDDIEGPARGEFDEGGERPIAEDPAGEAAAAELAALVYAIEEETIALVKQRCRARSEEHTSELQSL